MLGNMNEQDIKKTVIQIVSHFHPEIDEEKMVDDYASMFWDKYQWMSGGTFSMMFPGQQNNIYNYAIQPEGNIYFAGEHCSLINAWIQGALVSALRSVEEIVKTNDKVVL
jgi:monoamine oxidase